MLPPKDVGKTRPVPEDGLVVVPVGAVVPAYCPFSERHPDDGLEESWPGVGVGVDFYAEGARQHVHVHELMEQTFN